MEATEVIVLQVSTCLLCNQYYDKKPLVNGNHSENHLNGALRTFWWFLNENREGPSTSLEASVNYDVLNGSGGEVPCCNECFTALWEVKELQNVVDEAITRRNEFMRGLRTGILNAARDSNESSLEPFWQPVRASIVRSLGLERQEYEEGTDGDDGFEEVIEEEVINPPKFVYPAYKGDNASNQGGDPLEEGGVSVESEDVVDDGQEEDPRMNETPLNNHQNSEPNNFEDSGLESASFGTPSPEDNSTERNSSPPPTPHRYDLRRNRRPQPQVNSGSCSNRKRRTTPPPCFVRLKKLRLEDFPNLRIGGKEIFPSIRYDKNKMRFSVSTFHKLPPLTRQDLPQNMSKCVRMLIKETNQLLIQPVPNQHLFNYTLFINLTLPPPSPLEKFQLFGGTGRELGRSEENPPTSPVSAPNREIQPPPDRNLHYANPLDNPEILSIVFNNVFTVKEMKNLRLVNRLWRDLTLERWRSQAVIKISGDANRQDGIILEDLIYRNIPDWGIYQIQTVPFERCRFLTKMTFPPGQHEQNEWLFWEMYGSHLKSLELDECVLARLEAVEGVKFLLLGYCPKLEELKIKSSNASPTEGGGLRWNSEEVRTMGFLNNERSTAANLKSLTISQPKINSKLVSDEEDWPWFAHNLLRMTPNLKNLKLDTKESVFPVLEALQAFQSHEIELESIDLSKVLVGSTTLSELDSYLTKQASPLNSLKLWILHDEGNLQTLKMSLILVQHTLSTLELRFQGHGTGIPEFFNLFSGFDFSQLKNLTLHFRTTSRQFPKIDFTCLRAMPLLKKFKCSFSGPFKTEWITRELSEGDLIYGYNFLGNKKRSFIQSNVEEFNYEGSFTPEARNLLKDWMPNARF